LLEFDLHFVDRFLNKCTSVLDNLIKIDDGSDVDIPSIAHERWRQTIAVIQDSFVSKGFGSCFYSDLSQAKSTKDPGLKNDFEFLDMVEHLFDDVYRQLKKDMKLVGKVLKEEHGKLFLK